MAVHNQAVAAGVSYVVTNLPDTLKSLGITPDNIEEMVKARLGVLLAKDPTVSAGAPVPQKGVATASKTIP